MPFDNPLPRPIPEGHRRLEDLGFASPQAASSVDDDVLRVLIRMREFHSVPANWCNRGGVGIDGESRCLIFARGHVMRGLGVYHDDAAISAVMSYLVGALPPDTNSLVIFNEYRGTTHAELMAFYDRAIVARQAELAKALS